MSRETELRSQIIKAKQAYYYGGQPIISDQEYDSLEDELRELAPGDPLLALVGAPVPPDAMLTKAAHRIPMGSQSKVNTSDEFRSWYKKSCDGLPVHLSLKGDGASAAAYFEAGELKQMISRGDGFIGEDITANALKFKGLPAVVPFGFTGAVRVEVILTVEDWEKVDPAKSKNPRNAGAGIMGRKNGKQAELLTCFAFDIDEIVEGMTREFESESQKIARISELGIRTIEHRLCHSVEEAIAYYDDVALRRPDLPIWIDGIVTKVEDLRVQRGLGITANRPKGQIAWKFDSSGAKTILRSVTVSGGHTGALIPNAQLEPVEIGGTTVANASLANWDEVQRLDLAIGDEVWLIKANDIIPKVIRVTRRGEERQAIIPPSVCPFCGGAVGRRKNTGGAEGVVLECRNDDCPKKSIGKIKRWITSVDLQGIGDSVRHALVRQLELENAAGLYTLRNNPEALANLVINEEKDLRLGNKRAQTILQGIEARRELSLVDFLGSLGIDRLGKRRVELMVNAAAGKLDTLADWREGKLRQEEFAEAVGAPNTGAAIQDGIESMAELIDGLLAAGVIVHDAIPVAALPPGTELKKTVCISGKLPSGKKKADYEDILDAAGYRLVDTVSQELTYLVLADPDSSSSKSKKARQLGVEIISEERLQELCVLPGS